MKMQTPRGKTFAEERRLEKLVRSMQKEHFQGGQPCAEELQHNPALRAAVASVLRMYAEHCGWTWRDWDALDAEEQSARNALYNYGASPSALACMNLSLEFRRRRDAMPPAAPRARRIR